jgi:hypothetical protein
MASSSLTHRVKAALCVCPLATHVLGGKTSTMRLSALTRLVFRRVNDVGRHIGLRRRRHAMALHQGNLLDVSTTRSADFGLTRCGADLTGFEPLRVTLSHRFLHLLHASRGNSRSPGHGSAHAVSLRTDQEGPGYVAVVVSIQDSI